MIMMMLEIVVKVKKFVLNVGNYSLLLFKLLLKLWKKILIAISLCMFFLAAEVYIFGYVIKGQGK